jgi:ABC-type methionine transport system ATPase subunit
MPPTSLITGFALNEITQFSQAFGLYVRIQFGILTKAFNLLSPTVVESLNLALEIEQKNCQAIFKVSILFIKSVPNLNAMRYMNCNLRVETTET